MADPNAAKRFQRAYAALYRYYESLVRDVTEAILAKEDSLEGTYTGAGEAIVERYGHLLGQTNNLLNILKAAQDRASGVLPPVRPKVSVESVSAPLPELAGELTKWFDENPRTRPLGVQIVPGEEKADALLVFEDHRAPAAPPPEAESPE